MTDRNLGIVAQVPLGFHQVYFVTTVVGKSVLVQIQEEHPEGALNTKRSRPLKP